MGVDPANRHNPIETGDLGRQIIDIANQVGVGVGVKIGQPGFAQQRDLLAVIAVLERDEIDLGAGFDEWTESRQGQRLSPAGAGVGATPGKADARVVGDPAEPPPGRPPAPRRGRKIAPSVREIRPFPAQEQGQPQA